MMMGEVIFGVDFKARREKEAIENYNTVIRSLILLIEEVTNDGVLIVTEDTAPSEMPPNDCA